MVYSEYTSDGMVSGGKASAYKNHIIKNIEIIGQRKLVIIGDGADYDLLMRTIDALRKKSVRVPEIAFRATISENEVDSDNNIKFFDELKGKASTFYVLIVKPFVQVELQLAAMAGVVGSSQEIAAALKSVCGYSDRDFCQMNDPDGSGLKGKMGNSKATSAVNSDAKKSAQTANGTAAQLAGYKGSMNGQRCFILGKNSAKLDELNTLLNERTFAMNDFCEFFTKTPQRPTYFLLTSPDAYLGNGKYIEGMECFINGDVKVFEDKFKKKPTYLAHMGNGLIDGLPTFQAMIQAWETARVFPLYEMIQLALYMGFSEIYIYGFDGLFELEYDSSGIGRKTADGAVPSFPEKVKQAFDRVKTYADNNHIRIVSMCETEGLSMFEQEKFGDIDFTTSAVFGKLSDK